jgi:hypothetical protein
MEYIRQFKTVFKLEIKSEKPQVVIRYYMKKCKHLKTTEEYIQLAEDVGYKLPENT